MQYFYYKTDLEIHNFHPRVSLRQQLKAIIFLISQYIMYIRITDLLTKNTDVHSLNTEAKTVYRINIISDSGEV